MGFIYRQISMKFIVEPYLFMTAHFIYSKKLQPRSD